MASTGAQPSGGRPEGGQVSASGGAGGVVGNGGGGQPNSGGIGGGGLGGAAGALGESGAAGDGGAGESGAAGSGGAAGVGADGGAAGSGATAGDGGAGGEGGAAVEAPVARLSVGYYNSCRVFSNGSLKCWGAWDVYGTDDQPFSFGLNMPVSSEKPLDVVGSSRVTVAQLTHGILHTCAVLSDHSLKCWGTNSVGQLGRGNVVNVHSPASVGPVSITSDANDRVQQVVTGQVHTCVLLASHAVKCWGYNEAGQLGLGHRAPIGDDELPSAAAAVSVTSDSTAYVVQLESGPQNTCALLSNDTLKCWGKSSMGELGDGIAGAHVIGDDELPSSIPDTPLTAGGAHAKQVVIGYHHMCLLLTDGTVKCWGRRDVLGYGAAAPQQPMRPLDSPPVSVAPPGTSVTQLSAGWHHTCALLSDGSVRCWGTNGQGLLGLGNITPVGDDELPSDVPALALSDVPGVTAVALSSGGGRHTCALLSDDTVRCWGAGESGQLGYGTDADNIGDDETPAAAGPVPF